jgi:hypothetical protein
MNFAIRFPSRLDKYIACDCNVASSDDNTKCLESPCRLGAVGRWLGRVSGSDGKEIVHRPHRSNQRPKATVSVRHTIMAASTQGLVDSVAALCDFNLTEEVKGIQIPGLYVVGQCDGAFTPSYGVFRPYEPHKRHSLKSEELVTYQWSSNRKPLPKWSVTFWALALADAQLFGCQHFAHTPGRIYFWSRIHLKYAQKRCCR